MPRRLRQDGNKSTNCSRQFASPRIGGAPHGMPSDNRRQGRTHVVAQADGLRGTTLPSNHVFVDLIEPIADAERLSFVAKRGRILSSDVC